MLNVTRNTVTDRVAGTHQDRGRNGGTGDVCTQGILRLRLCMRLIAAMLQGWYLGLGLKRQPACPVAVPRILEPSSSHSPAGHWDATRRNRRRVSAYSRLS